MAMTSDNKVLKGLDTFGCVEGGVFSCPKRCPSSVGRDRGFYSGMLMEGGVLQLQMGAVHSLVMLIDGEMYVDSVEAENYILTAGHMVLCYREYAYTLTATKPCEYIVAYFASPGTACDVAMLHQRYQAEVASLPFGAVRIVPALGSLLVPLQRFLADRMPCGHMHVSMLETLFVVLRFYYPIGDQLVLLRNLLGSKVSFHTLVENALPKARRANELAELCGYDPITFNTVFRRHFNGLTPYVWMQERRKEQVFNLLRNDALSLQEVREQAGFSSESRFGEYCKKYLGDTPSRVRAQLK